MVSQLIQVLRIKFAICCFSENLRIANCRIHQKLRIENGACFVCMVTWAQNRKLIRSRHSHLGKSTLAARASNGIVAFELPVFVAHDCCFESTTTFDQ